DHVNIASRDEVYHACRALLVHRPDEIAVFDRAFAAFWRAHDGRIDRADRPGERPAAGIELVDAAAGELSGTGPTDKHDGEWTSGALKTWSDAAGIANKDFATLTDEEQADAREALARLAWSPGERRTRRWIRGRGPRFDLRQAIADSRRTGGDLVTLRRRVRRVRTRPLVLVCDISGSMERYSRMLLHFAHAIAARHHRV